MTKIIIPFIFLFVSILSFSQTNKSENTDKYNADKDIEFDSGSKIVISNLNASQIENLTMLGKVWGFLKYYHPSIGEGNYNWDYELFRIIPKILDSKDDGERNNVLYNWIDSFGKIETTKTWDKKEKVRLEPDLKWINNSTLSEKIVLQLTNIKNAKRTENNYYIGKYQNVGNPEFKNERSYPEMKFPDAGFRLLCLYRYWNIIQYYFPYKYLIGEDWNETLKEFIPKFLNATNELEYKLTVLALIARIHDTHAMTNFPQDVVLNKYRGVNYAPIEITFVENKAVVTNYYDKSLGNRSGLKIGDIIESVNNKHLDELIKEKLVFTSGSNYPTQLRNLAPHLLRTNDSSLTIVHLRGSSKATIEVECYPKNKIDFKEYEKSKKDTCFKLLSPEITYLYLGTINNIYLPLFLPDILKSKGLIIDLRCYPRDNIIFSLNEHLLPKQITFSTASFADMEIPGLFTITDSIASGKENKDFYKGKVMILVNEKTQSQAEFTAMAFRTAPNSKIIGSTTAGADGNTSSIILPGGIWTQISGIGIYYPDGKETQRMGIVPDIVVKPTIKGITEGKDELLEKAIEIINEK